MVLHTLVGALNYIGPTQRAMPLVLVLHLDHAADAKQVAAVESNGQPAEGEA
jgi:hypothetical protein